MEIDYENISSIKYIGVISLRWNSIFLFLGGLFDMTDTVQEIAFRYAVDRVNSDREVLPRSRLTAQIERIPQQDSFYASKQGWYLKKVITPLCI